MKGSGKKHKEIYFLYMGVVFFILSGILYVAFGLHDLPAGTTPGYYIANLAGLLGMIFSVVFFVFVFKSKK